MFKIGIIGATGYVGVELLRLLLNHDKVTVAAISSSTFKDEEISSVYKSFFNKTNLICEDIDDVIDKCDVVFTALPHGLSEEIANKAITKNKKIIDLGADFRLDSEEEYKKWYGKTFLNKELHKYSIYALPEFNGDKIKDFNIIANPGCYPTSIQLGLMPLLENNLINTKNIICDSKSGITGAGRSLSLKSHFSEANENFSAYAIGSHRHSPEIEQALSHIANDNVEVTFTPHLLPINRGILSTIYCETKNKLTLEEIHEIYTIRYKNKDFVHVLPLGETAEIKHVKYTNNCHISLHQNYRKDKLIIISVIDNMVKGAAGQAIQNMNLLLGLPENLGLTLIAPSF
ncbi:N-acetyl-gamma-glutamyl-phosphate reductase [Clostridium celatum]|uniref:N-acetyl-gamma-glutamyl-phosphate reductase n=1 Tax=Clostridium celatum DSM 1785 TaxID=545697 RepID=L1QJL0_9CLOT|nr:N-acetyl-gamma-glutamyl-phosphate reductase [Clostridium celatum]EKY28199.1 N-acetyl-gamma-glutamyl-phosphate reductase [Clostridium celatum DSM 1785]MCE9654048.1 N-acetyl-gamma-glutamyl-phosphate reductase [Clostridium celatum]MDU2266647.1 N-acetyl-gamma-glutamyl-phosphate reductase [Clostridium celatum]MDU3724033.1 N-acetyl-gamma-glutamyl-phosphate reductase [Clostridium celatum]MDU6296982.1 N-acetyl-gamma-glutamyl-phosphate reductase [Clostridium celatum]